VVARELLGAVLVRRTQKDTLRARIVETEAYVGQHDLACHAARGLTERTAVMFGPPGRAYVYLVYGMHDMLNVVTAGEGDPQAVLIRACEPNSGDAERAGGAVERMDGPGRLTKALLVTRDLNGHDLNRPPLWIEAGSPPPRVEVGPRVGVDYAAEWADAPLRFFDADSQAVSRSRSRRLSSERAGPKANLT